VGAQARPDRLEVREDLARLEVRTTVERHVLDQVGEAALIVGLHHRPCLDGKPHRDSLRRLVVLPDEVLETVRERGRSDCSVERHRRLQVDRRLSRETCGRNGERDDRQAGQGSGPAGSCVHVY